MNLKDFEKHKAAIWDKCEKECGFPLVREFRNFVEREEVGDPKEYINGDPEGEESYLASLQSVSEKYVTAMRLIPKGKPSHDEKPSQPKRRYRKCSERRFYLVNFVIDRPYKRGTLIDWKRMVTEWNRAHPSDLMSLSALRVEYQRALKEDSLMLQVYIIRNTQVLTNTWQALGKRFKDLANGNPINFGMAALAGQKLWNDNQPLIVFLAEAIKKSPRFKEIQVHSPKQAARLESELEAIVNVGDLKPLV